MNDDRKTLADLSKQIRKQLLDGGEGRNFQLLPPLDDLDLDELRESVDARGIRVPVELDAQDRILDGHHRLKVARELGLSPAEVPVVVREDIQGEEDAVEYVLEVNLGRRHLTRQGRRKLAAELRDRGWSLRRIANRLRVHHETIRRDLTAVANATGAEDSEPPETVEGADGKRYPATSSSRAPSNNSDDSKGSSQRPPAHVQGRDGGAPSGSRNSSSRRLSPGGACSTSASGDADDDSEPDQDPRREHLNAADFHLGKAKKLTPEAEADVREELDELADRCNALVRYIDGTGNIWVVPS